MTVTEIRSSLPTMVIWMAKEAVMEGVKSYHKAQKQYDIEDQKKESGLPYNYALGHAYKDGVHVAAEILWKLFASCTIDCMEAIETVAEKKDGYCGDPDRYFDDFVLALEKRLGDPIRIRKCE